MFGTLDDFFSPACGIPPPRRCAGGFPQTTGAAEIDSGAESQAFAWARLAPTLVGPAGSNCRWLDSSGYIGNLCSRETGLNFYISNEMGRVSASPFVRLEDFACAPSLELDERDLFSVTFAHFVFCS